MPRTEGHSVLQCTSVPNYLVKLSLTDTGLQPLTLLLQVFNLSWKRNCPWLWLCSNGFLSASRIRCIKGMKILLNLKEGYVHLVFILLGVFTRQNTTLCGWNTIDIWWQANNFFLQSKSSHTSVLHIYPPLLTPARQKPAFQEVSPTSFRLTNNFWPNMKWFKEFINLNQTVQRP